MTDSIKLSDLLAQMKKRPDMSIGMVAYVVEQGSGTIHYLVIDEMNLLSSNPTQGNYKVKNLYVDAITGKLVVEYDDTPTS